MDDRVKGFVMDEWSQIWAKLTDLDIHDFHAICREPDISVVSYELDIAVEMYEIRRNRYPMLKS